MKNWKGKRNVRENLSTRLPALADEWFDAGHKALATNTSWEQMHRFRLLTKRFRYTIEMFRPAYGPGLERKVEMLRRLQTLLGEMNDCIVTPKVLEGIEGLDLVRGQLSESAEEKSAQLQSAWSQEFEAPGQREAWRRYLAQYACRPGRVPAVRPLPPPETDIEEVSSQSA